ncbi:unnamed protein product, partial [Strongylus vulgaris]
KSTTDDDTEQSHSFECKYHISDPNNDTFIILEITSLPRKGSTVVIVSYNASRYILEVTCEQEILVIPSNSVDVVVKSLQAKNAEILLCVQYLHKDSQEIALRSNAFTIKWLPSMEEKKISNMFHSLKFVVDNVHMGRTNSSTLLFEGLNKTEDSLSVNRDGLLKKINSPVTYRIEDSFKELQIEVTQKSANFSMAIRYSQDCPEFLLPRGVNCSSLRKYNQFGSSVHFTCAQGSKLYGADHAKCLMGGEWSSNPPTCLKTPPKFCALPIIESGYVNNVESPTGRLTYSYGSKLFYGCNFGYTKNLSVPVCTEGKWVPSPLCTVGNCNFPKTSYKNSTFYSAHGNDTTLNILTRVDYDGPD